MPRARWKGHIRFGLVHMPVNFAHGIADATEQDAPVRSVATAALARRIRRTCGDDLRDGRGATAVASWSVRARPGLPVRVPVTLEESPGLGRASCFHLQDAIRRARDADRWPASAAPRQRIPKAALDTSGVP